MFTQATGRLLAVLRRRRLLSSATYRAVLETSIESLVAYRLFYIIFLYLQKYRLFIRDENNNNNNK
jgi:hypothetical protein